MVSPPLGFNLAVKVRAIRSINARTSVDRVMGVNSFTPRVSEVKVARRKAKPRVFEAWRIRRLFFLDKVRRGNGR